MSSILSEATSEKENIDYTRFLDLLTLIKENIKNGQHSETNNIYHTKGKVSRLFDKVAGSEIPSFEEFVLMKAEMMKNETDEAHKEIFRTDILPFEDAL